MKYSAIVLLGLLTLSTTASAALYRWVDDNGKVHYSDSVPPSKAQRGHTELDTFGNRTKKVEPAKSKEQVAEEAWLGELESKLEVKRSQQRRKDKLLLSSYASVEQFDAFYADRLNILKDERAQLELLKGKLENELERLLNEYKNSKHAGAKKRVQGFVDTNIGNTEAYQQAITQNLAEEATIREEAQVLRKRFLNLLKKKEEKNS